MSTVPINGVLTTDTFALSISSIAFLPHIAEVEVQRFGSHTIDTYLVPGISAGLPIDTPTTQGSAPNYGDKINLRGFSEQYINGFQHAYWMALNTYSYGDNTARYIGLANEYGELNKELALNGLAGISKRNIYDLYKDTLISNEEGITTGLEAKSLVESGILHPELVDEWMQEQILGKLERGIIAQHYRDSKVEELIPQWIKDADWSPYRAA